MPDIDVPNIININVNRIDTNDGSCTNNWCTNKAIPQSPCHEQQYANKMLEIDRTEKCYAETNNSKPDSTDKPTVENKLSNTINYFLPSHNHTASPKRFWRCFSGIRCFDSTFSLQLKPDSKPYQTPLRHVAYTLQKPFKEEFKMATKQEIITPLGIDETAEWFNSFVLVPKSNRRVRLCLDSTRLNQALIRLVHRRPTLNDILPKLNNANYPSLIDAISGYHNLKLDEISSYLMIFACQFGR